MKSNPSDSKCDFILIYSFFLFSVPKEQKQHSKQTLQVDLITDFIYFRSICSFIEIISENENKQKCDRDLQSVLRERERTENELQENASFQPHRERE